VSARLGWPAALAHQACRQGYSAYYVRLPRLLDELSIGRADGRYGKLLKQLARIDVIVIDDWGLAVLNDVHRRDLLEVLDDRHGARSTIVTSQLPIDHWHAAIGDATLADAILDRLVHNAHQINLNEDSLRKSVLVLQAHPIRSKTLTSTPRRYARSVQFAVECVSSWRWTA
jgi:DNA replication protein DnaC